MTIGIYSILNKITLKRYIGKSINIEARFIAHKYWLVKPNKNKDCNRHLYNAVQKYGIANFEFLILEPFWTVDENQLKDAELKWMDFYKTCDRNFGYNLRRDSSTSCVVHDETLKLRSAMAQGENNPNFGNKWSDQQRINMSAKQTERHSLGIAYGADWKNKISISSKFHWSHPELKAQMAKSVSEAKSTHDFYKYDTDGTLLETYTSIHEVISKNPAYKWQNIYAACNGNKKSYMGFLWRRMEKNSL